MFALLRRANPSRFRRMPSELLGLDNFFKPISVGVAVNDDVVASVTGCSPETIEPETRKPIDNYQERLWIVQDPSVYDIRKCNEVEVSPRRCPAGQWSYRCKLRNHFQDFFDIDLTVEVHDLRHLNGILQTLRSRPLVSSVHRVTG